MKYLLFSTLLCCSLFFTACDKEETAGPINAGTDELYFGDYYGECFGNCAFIYRLTSEELRRHETNNMYSDPVVPGEVGATVLLPDSLLSLTSELFALFPEVLFDEEEVIGMPDAYDQGGYYVAIGQEDSYRTWRIDTDLRNVPENLHPFLEEVRQVLNALRE